MRIKQIFRKHEERRAVISWTPHNTPIAVASHSWVPRSSPVLGFYDIPVAL